MSKGGANVYVFHYAAYGDDGSTLAMRQEYALAKSDPEGSPGIYNHFCYKTKKGARTVDRRRQVVFTLDFADPSNEKEAEQLASKLGEALWPKFIVN